MQQGPLSKFLPNLCICERSVSITEKGTTTLITDVGTETKKNSKKCSEKLQRRMQRENINNGMHQVSQPYYCHPSLTTIRISYLILVPVINIGALFFL
jgi:hypothetical protein